MNLRKLSHTEEAIAMLAVYFIAYIATPPADTWAGNFVPAAAAAVLIVGGYKAATWYVHKNQNQAADAS